MLIHKKCTQGSERASRGLSTRFLLWTLRFFFDRNTSLVGRRAISRSVIQNTAISCQVKKESGHGNFLFETYQTSYPPTKIYEMQDSSSRPSKTRLSSIRLLPTTSRRHLHRTSQFDRRWTPCSRTAPLGFRWSWSLYGDKSLGRVLQERGTGFI